MINKKSIFSLCIVFFSFLSSPIYALKIRYSNLSDVSDLTYSHIISKQSSAWKIIVGADKKIHCWNYSEEQKNDENEIECIVKLKPGVENLDIEQGILLLDITGEDKNLLALITDINGNGKYSNVIYCRVEEEKTSGMLNNTGI